LGLAIGSFLNVVIARVPHEQSIVRPRSRCPKCGHSLAWYENIPLVSWLVQRGRCRGCRAPISLRYPLIELLTALLFLVCFRRFGWTVELLSALVFVSLLIPLTFIDIEHYLLPFSLTVPGIAAGVALSALQGVPRLIESAVGAAVGYSAFWLLELVGRWLLKKEALGGGDKVLLAMIGAFLGYQPLLGVIFLSSVQGSILGVTFLLLRGRAGPELPSGQDGAAVEQEKSGAKVSAGEAAPKAGAPSREEAAPTGASPREASPRAGQAPHEVAPKAGPSPHEDAPASSSEGAAPPGADAQSEEDDWVPGPTNMPYGPYLALAALEILLLGQRLAQWLPEPLGILFAGTG
jgi:leader peptidase (prepilin peptidase) / N-methyltransferase